MEQNNRFSNKRTPFFLPALASLLIIGGFLSRDIEKTHRPAAKNFINWHSQTEAMQLSKHLHKPILYVFTESASEKREYRGPSERLELEFLALPQIARKLNQEFICVKDDHSQPEMGVGRAMSKLEQTFAIVVCPALVVYLPERKKHKVYSGFRTKFSAEEFLSDALSSIYCRDKLNIDWRPLKLALKEQQQTHKPLLIVNERGYSRVEFQDAAITEKVNKDFIPIKVYGDLDCQNVEPQESAGANELALLEEDLKLGTETFFAVVPEDGNPSSCTGQYGTSTILKFLNRSTKKYGLLSRLRNQI